MDHSSPDSLPLSFHARVVVGAGRGKKMGVPTLNLELHDVPPELKYGIYASRVKIAEDWLDGALHYGPRPVFKDDVACEVHLLDAVLPDAPKTLAIRVIAYIREVRNFASVDQLKKQIDDDIAHTRNILREST